MAKGNPIPTKARRIVKERDENRCQRCGGLGTDIHHRQRRREGGHEVGNLVLLCRLDHSWVHGNPAVARETGYIIPTHITDPTTIPFKLWTGEWEYTDNDGGYRLSLTKDEA